MALTPALLCRSDCTERDLPCTFRKRRRKDWRGNARREIPIGKYRAELRLRRQAPVDYHQLARDRLRPGVDRDLPVHILFHEADGNM